MIFIQISLRDKNLIIKLENDLDHHVASEIKDEIDRQIIMTNPDNIIFDFENVKFMDSSGIGLISGRISTLKIQEEDQNLKNNNNNINKNKKIAIVNIDNRLSTIMKISGLDKSASFYKDIESAINDFGKK